MLRNNLNLNFVKNNFKKILNKIFFFGLGSLKSQIRLCIVVAVYNKVSFTKHTFTGLEEDNERFANIS